MSDNIFRDMAIDAGFREVKTEQQKAEAYVREKLPELKGCECVDCQMAGKHNSSPIQLQHWLRVLAKDIDNSNMPLGEVHIAGVSLYVQPDPNRDFFKFNLTTGQPATELDYKAFNDIVGV
jgi:hypothetical protein